MTGGVDVAFVTLILVTTVSMLRDPIVGSDAGLTFSRELMWGNQTGVLNGTERAAFVVDRGNGELACLIWPATHQHEQERFEGAMPVGTVAIIHTHPARVPMPSPQDQMESLRLGIPIYALTPFRVTKAVPYSQWPVIVHKGAWATRPKGGPHCKALAH